MLRIYSFILWLLTPWVLVGETTFEGHARALSIVRINDLVEESGYYRVSGEDPYIVFNSNDVEELLIQYRVADRLESTVIDPFEFFWANDQHGFNEANKLLLSLDSEEQHLFNVDLNEVSFFAPSITQNTQLRFDLPPEFINYFQFNVGTPLDEPDAVNETAVGTFLVSSIPTTLPENSPIREVNDLVYKDGYLQMYGGDPYVVIDLAKIENVQPGFLSFNFRPMDPQYSGREYAYIEGFWAAETHGFTEAHKFFAMLPNMREGGHYRLDFTNVLDVRESDISKVTLLRIDLPYDLDRIFEFSLAKDDQAFTHEVSARFPINPHGLNDARIFQSNAKRLIFSFFSKIFDDLLFAILWLGLKLGVIYFGFMRSH